MIIIGYPGVGKSSICGSKNSIIDLESSFFHSEYVNINGTWIEPYVNVAADLHRQGFTVCISSHKAIRNMLIGRTLQGVNINTDVAMIYPDRSLKDEWIKRLENRYYETRANNRVSHSEIEKNYRAWQRAIDYYDIDIYDMSQCKEFINYVIKDVKTYDIRVAIDRILNKEKY